MTHPWEITGQRVLVFGDVHQNVDWARAIIAKEQGNYDAMVFLGDIFDTHLDGPLLSTAAQSAQFVKELIRGEFGPATWLAGNHDLSYMEAFYHVAKHYTPTSLRHFCPGYTNSKAKIIQGVLTEWSDWRRIELFKVVNGWLLSHAGFRGSYWNDKLDVTTNFQTLYQESQEALELLPFKASRFQVIGMARGGTGYYGGPTWLDWNHEFEDDFKFRQIVGHTPEDNTIRKIDRSFCIDGSQSTYVLIQPDGFLEFRSIARIKNDDADLWLEQTPFLRDDTLLLSMRRDATNSHFLV